MKYNCELIRDLRPLYQDGICSPSSKTAVEEHLGECKDCSGYLENLRSGEELEEIIVSERGEALDSQKKFFGLLDIS
jgi:predicted anti-sigma-YlaC factor YlaD